MRCRILIGLFLLSMVAVGADSYIIDSGSTRTYYLVAKDTPQGTYILEDLVNYQDHTLYVGDSFNVTFNNDYYDINNLLRVNYTISTETFEMTDNCNPNSIGYDIKFFINPQTTHLEIETDGKIESLDETIIVEGNWDRDHFYLEYRQVFDTSTGWLISYYFRETRKEDDASIMTFISIDPEEIVPQILYEDNLSSPTVYSSLLIIVFWKSKKYYKNIQP
ncbi:MAG: hypothetical protein INQ03_10870 [Candidatus Heimdallarchaeota archaeon]|nr:hypothetical protein [Candidatus Heimdallarchaeota archaeon]